jgi:hypothetical protein
LVEQFMVKRPKRLIREIGSGMIVPAAGFANKHRTKPGTAADKRV